MGKQSEEKSVVIKLANECIIYTCLLLNHCLMIQQEFLALYKNTSNPKNHHIHADTTQNTLE